MENNKVSPSNIQTASPNFKQRIGSTCLDILIFLLLCFGVYVTLAVLSRLLFSLAGSTYTTGITHHSWMQMADEACLLSSALLSAWTVLHRRKVSLRHLGLVLQWKDALKGMLLALLFFSAGLGISVLTDAIHIVSATWHYAVFWPLLCLFLLVSLTEEVIIRGFVLGRLLDGGINRWIALIISSLLFALLHFFNPSFSAVAFLNILLAGMLLSIPFIYTGNLSFSIALHWFWNWIQGPVLGFNVSGNETESLLTLRYTTSNLLNGGSFGFEGSLICSALLILAVAGTTLYFKKASAHNTSLRQKKSPPYSTFFS